VIRWFEGDPNGVAELEKVEAKAEFEYERVRPGDVAEDALCDKGEAYKNADGIDEEVIRNDAVKG